MASFKEWIENEDAWPPYWVFLAFFGTILGIIVVGLLVT